MRIDAFIGPYRWLSNFWPAPVVLDGETYPTVEHVYQAAKTLSANGRARIQGVLTPGQAKRMGRVVPLHADWEQIQLPMMLALLRQKFAIDPLRQWLLDTKDAELVEGNCWGDTFWGEYHGKGQNHLGRLLMQVRKELRHA